MEIQSDIQIREIRFFVKWARKFRVVILRNASQNCLAEAHVLYFYLMHRVKHQQHQNFSGRFD